MKFIEEINHRNKKSPPHQNNILSTRKDIINRFKNLATHDNPIFFSGGFEMFEIFFLFSITRFRAIRP